AVSAHVRGELIEQLWIGEPRSLALMVAEHERRLHGERELGVRLTQRLRTRFEARGESGVVEELPEQRALVGLRISDRYPDRAATAEWVLCAGVALVVRAVRRVAGLSPRSDDEELTGFRQLLGETLERE